MNNQGSSKKIQSCYFFPLQTTDDSLSATICKCDTSNNLGSNVCNKLGNNLQERLEFVKAKLEAPTKAAPASGLSTLAISSPNAHIFTPISSP